MTSGGTPVLILKEGSNQSKGKEAQRNNIAAAKLIAEIVKTSVGPRGMDKMLVDSLGDVTITNDGATMLKEIDVQHPAAKMLVEVSKATDNEVGDGTTSAVILAGALLEKAEELIDKGVHPTVIVEGYNKAARKAVEFLGEFAEKVSPTNKEWLIKIARTSMQTKLVSREAQELAELVVAAATQVAEKTGTTYKVDLSNIKVEKKPGGSLKDTKLVMGFVLDKEVAHSGMPRKIENAKIAIVNAAFEIEKTEFDAKLNISDPSMMKKFLDEETHMLKDMVDKVVAIGANVLICQKGLDDIAQHYLAKAGILAVRRVKESDMTNLAKATGARIANNFEDLSVKDLGYAALVEERKIEQDKWVFIEGTKNPKAVTILVRGGTQRIVDEADRSLIYRRLRRNGRHPRAARRWAPGSWSKRGEGEKLGRAAICDGARRNRADRRARTRRGANRNLQTSLCRFGRGVANENVDGTSAHLDHGQPHRRQAAAVYQE